MASSSGSVPLRRELISSCSGGLPRGLISCLHCRANDLSDHDFRQAVNELVAGFYQEAFDRLPRKTDAMQKLLRLLTTTGGSCLGLLDPVSNIILNTLALLPYHNAASADSDSDSPPAKRSRRSKRQAWAALDHADHACRFMARRSCSSLVDFLLAYFGCLTTEQAFRYLYWAGADLPLAVMLVQHDLYQQPHALDPDSPRTQAALKSAATQAGHPSPDTLVNLMAIRLYTHDGFTLLKKIFSGDPITSDLTSENITAIHRLLHRPSEDMAAERTTTSVHVSSDGSTITTTTTTVRPVAHRITSLRHTDHMAATLASCLPKAAYGAQKHTLCGGGDMCDYQQSLKMYLQGMIHDLYLTALSLLPTPSASLINSILMAGHCYGSMDPVSNIIVNSIWYNKCSCPLPEPDRVSIELFTDILDPLSLLRTELHSLRGLRELAAFADPQFSTANSALENLSSAKCDIVNMLTSSSSSSSSSTQRNPFHKAAMAAGHPLPLQLGELHQQLLLMPVERNKLLSLLTEARTSGTVLPMDEIASILNMVSSSSSRAQTPVPVQAPKLCVEALSVVSSNRSNYEERRSWFYKKLERLLEEYSSQHLQEPKYTLDFICGVEESKTGYYPGPRSTCHHVNFMATCGLRLQKTLFFAEFWSYATKKPKPKFCCPIPFPYTGGCYYGVHKARRIVYPERVEYIRHDVRADRVDGMLEMDFVHFSSTRET